MNRHNCRYCVDSNLKIFHVIHTVAIGFFLWGHLKSQIYAIQPISLGDQRIVDECRQINQPTNAPEYTTTFRAESFNYRMEIGDQHFEQLLH
ncbi:hypothetical protein ALC57_00965 [Trachymyrmex cornetzi]|uniref:Uncharacterized protein n=1 Tax=Trachymyrmex cornetzi TaxID=471704 RepID=A0A195EP88_9HYME|nr:hypothetical protein ALC57_00965 [Trachymyrmex cornetzi]